MISYLRFLMVSILACTATLLSAAEFLWQGTILTSESTVPTQRTQTLEFRLYRSSTATDALWGRAVTIQLASDGTGVATLSDSVGSPINDVPEEGLGDLLASEDDLWLGLTVQGGEELTPRQSLGEGSQAIVAESTSGAVPGKAFTVKGRLFASQVTVPNFVVTGDLEVSGNVVIASGGISADQVSVEGTLSGYGVPPIGTIISVYSADGTMPTMPDGWLFCDGTGGTPDLRDRFVLGAYSSTLPGQTGGEESVTLSLNQIPSHKHGFSYTKATNTDGAPDSGNDSSNDSGRGYWRNQSSGDQHVSTSSSSTGGTQAHENRPPFHALYWFMRVE